MRPPPIRVRVLGHPLVMVPVHGTGVFILYQWTQQPELWVLGLMALAAMVLVAKASERRMEFVRWRRNWDAMADGPRPAPTQWLARLAIAIIVPAAFVAYESGALDGLVKPAIAIAWLLAVGLAGTMIWRGRRWFTRRPRPASRSGAVSVVARSTLAAPSLTVAYRALPSHCWRVLDPASD